MSASKKLNKVSEKNMTTSEIMVLHDKYGTNHYSKDHGCVIDHADGVWVWDLDGKKYLDMNATYSAIAVGHRNLELINAISDQMLKITSTQNKFTSLVQVRLLESICELTGQDKAILMNTGAEAVDTAVKAARRWAYRVKGIPKDKAEIVTFVNNFHGRTINAIAMSATKTYRKDFGPYPPGYVCNVPFGNYEALVAAINTNTAAIIVEPIQGEGGIVIPPDDYLRKIRELCYWRNTLLIFDEIQTGLGRTGKLFGYQHYDVKPDGIILGKALGGYIPVSALAGSEELMNVFTPGSHGSTFGGSHLACAAALKSIELITRDDCALVWNAHSTGTYFLDRLLKHQIPARGKGLFIGVPLDPAKKTAENACHELLERGIIAGAASNNVVRFSPALILTRDNVDFAIPLIVEVLK